MKDCGKDNYSRLKRIICEQLSQILLEVWAIVLWAIVLWAIVLWAIVLWAYVRAPCNLYL